MSTFKCGPWTIDLRKIEIGLKQTLAHDLIIEKSIKSTWREPVGSWLNGVCQPFGDCVDISLMHLWHVVYDKLDIV